ncbi:hypothetical protein OP10G_1328 [Fimbriimonas ginsengisoli Gsoil 348]|uniref:Ferredoxin n=2 Tax=Fimbriimonas ginsengisoli TaxID=1005039 RepID=A0A068NML2_FIMGI|nr:hypothetical protein OP10G_1328 [Fimbriimonas ginsengisoli Gsoil 348]
MDECIKNCQECHAACASLIPHCLHLGGSHSSKEHIGLLQDCAHICATALSFMLRESPRHTLTCGACAAVCRECATDCEAGANGDAWMLACAEQCRTCADSCARMVSLRMPAVSMH